MLAPADEDTPRCRRTWSRPGGRCRCRYNGSVARLAFGPLSAARVRRWLRDGRFDVLHVHEPFTPSLSMLAVHARRGPDGRDLPHRDHAVAGAVGARARSLQPVLEKITGRIAVSAAARAGPGRAPRRRRGGDPQRRDGRPVRRRRAVARLARRRRHDRLPGPLSTSRARGSPCCSTALARLVAGPARAAAARRRPRRRRRRAVASCRRRCAGASRSSAWSARRTRPGCCASVDVYVRAEHRR